MAGMAGGGRAGRAAKVMARIREAAWEGLRRGMGEADAGQGLFAELIGQRFGKAVARLGFGGGLACVCAAICYPGAGAGGGSVAVVCEGAGLAD